MGSLMPGWSTSPSRADEAFRRSSSSLTKEEVERFWRYKKLLAQEHLEEANKAAALSQRMTGATAKADENDTETRLDDAEILSTSLPEINSIAWWTKSKWAFLNDPPSMDVKQAKYVAQFDIATLGQLQIDSTEHPAT